MHETTVMKLQTSGSEELVIRLLFGSRDLPG